MRTLKFIWAGFGVLVPLAAFYYRVIDPELGQDVGARCFLGGFLLLIVLVTCTVGEIIGQALHDARTKRRGFDVAVKPPGPEKGDHGGRS